ncbi:hypothetical protein FQZ97_831960 [compost metagenome]
MTASCRSRALRSSCSMPLSSRSCSTGSSVDAVCASMACVMTSSPTRLITWSTFSTPTRIEVDSLSACAGAAGRVARAACVMASAAAADSATAGAGAAAAGTGADAATAAGSGAAAGAAAAGAASRAMLNWSPSTMKQHTASISSGVQVLSIQTVKAPSARSLAVTVPRLPISSSRDAASLSDTLVIRTRSGTLPASAGAACGAGCVAAGCTGAGAGAAAATAGAGAGAGTGAGVAAAGSLCSSASCLNTAQIRSNTASSGSSEAR